MTTGTVLKWSFISSLIIMLAGAWLRMVHQPGSDWILGIGLLLSGVFVLTALYEILTSRSIHRSEKVLWTVGMVLMGGIVGLVYLFAARERIAASR